ncbi:hypothetical protein BKA83DRAFT_1716932 [Pisolithus microcarpus]|nr:hypothetical protein BKA83DRAFT_1716932 [Pisolithus microcarpus]
MVRCAFVIPVLIASRGGTCIVWYCNAIPFTPPCRCHSIVIRSFQLSAPSKSGCCCVNLQKRSSKQGLYATSQTTRIDSTLVGRMVVDGVSTASGAEGVRAGLLNFMSANTSA